MDLSKERAYADLFLPNGPLARSYVRNYVYHYELPNYTPDFLARYFVPVFAQALRDDTIASSNPRAVINHWAYAPIASLGEAAFPFIFERLDQEPFVWLSALPFLVGETAVTPEHRGRTAAMINDWKLWARNHHYLV
ncbi:MAG TPA: hypothetical protein VMG98_03425 [Verrucomicrobiae bacterium]|nr:hypothetical protein [Verrucomicrobiae bacterium]